MINETLSNKIHNKDIGKSNKNFPIQTYDVDYHE